MFDENFTEQDRDILVGGITNEFNSIRNIVGVITEPLLDEPYEVQSDALMKMFKDFGSDLIEYKPSGSLGEDLENIEKAMVTIERNPDYAAKALYSQARVAKLEIDAPGTDEYRNAVAQSAHDNALAKAIYAVNGGEPMNEFQKGALQTQAELARSEALLLELSKPHAMEAEEWPNQYRQAYLLRDRDKAMVRLYEITVQAENRSTPPEMETELNDAVLDVLDAEQAMELNKRDTMRTLFGDNLDEKSIEGQNAIVEGLYKEAALINKGKGIDIAAQGLSTGKPLGQVAGNDVPVKGQDVPKVAGDSAKGVWKPKSKAGKIFNMVFGVSKTQERMRDPNVSRWRKRFPIISLLVNLLVKMPFVGDFIGEVAQIFKEPAAEKSEIKAQKEKAPKKVAEKVPEVEVSMQSFVKQELINEIKQMNPGVRLNYNPYAADFKITADIPLSNLKLPKGFYYNEELGITNKGNTRSGEYYRFDAQEAAQVPPIKGSLKTIKGNKEGPSVDVPVKGVEPPNKNLSTFKPIFG